MDFCNKFQSSINLPNPITQVASMSYDLYQSIQGNFFLGSTDELIFGNGTRAWAGLFNPFNSNVNFFVYSWEVANTGDSPIRAQIWFNSYPTGQPMRVLTVAPGNTALCPLPKPKVKFLQATNVTSEPEDGVKAFVRRAQANTTVGDVEFGKFIFAPGGSFLIDLSNPEAPNEPAKAIVSYTWFEEKINC
ncbi:DUF6143 family protein [Clostridium paridis]|uniref:Uncharacterized protein n=1 Tax=Clostridium paridis TaxID=2803863 RepID=A0A937K5C4_9CLOT|nr:DUF6143 family protein [Clostridium paridis]MBL4933537.1 hypothetical protein [Clostridium paridis]